MRKIFRRNWCLTPILFLSLAAQAQDYPAREIRSICNFAAGSGADIVVRYYSDQLAKLAGKPVIVENRPRGPGSGLLVALLNGPAPQARRQAGDRREPARRAGLGGERLRRQERARRL